MMFRSAQGANKRVDPQSG